MFATGERSDTKILVLAKKCAQKVKANASAMLQCKRKKIFLLEISAILFIFFIQTYGEENFKVFDVKTFATEHLLGSLTRLEKLKRCDASCRFTLLLGEFLLKQKTRFYEPTRQEAQLYYTIFQKINNINPRGNTTRYSAVQADVLHKVFNKDLLLTPPTLKSGYIDKHLPYAALAQTYNKLGSTGIPGGRQSDACMAAITSMHYKHCFFPDHCMSALRSDLPSYGYYRSHQLILLYMFMHHKCATAYGSQAAYEILAKDKCTETFREQNALRALGLPAGYYDLFLEQHLVCGGLFGHMEFLNVPNIMEVSTWFATGPCNCTYGDRLQPMHCPCHNHIDSVAVSFYSSILTYLN